MSSAVARPLAGVATIVTIVAVVALSITLFQGGFGTTVPVTITLAACRPGDVRRR